MTPDFWKQIQPQLNEQISNVLGESMPAAELIAILMGRYYYWQQEPFKSMKLHFENVDLTFHQWFNACEALMGSAVSDAFEDTMRKRIADTIEHQHELWLKEGGEKLAHELKEVA